MILPSNYAREQAADVTLVYISEIYGENLRTIFVLLYWLKGFY